MKLPFLINNIYTHIYIFHVIFLIKNYIFHVTFTKGTFRSFLFYFIFFNGIFRFYCRVELEITAAAFLISRTSGRLPLLSFSTPSRLLQLRPFQVPSPPFASELHSRFSGGAELSLTVFRRFASPYHVRLPMANLRTDSPVACRIVRAFLDFLNSGLCFSPFSRSFMFL